MIATVIRDNNAVAATLNAVIVYDTFDAAVRSARQLERDGVGAPAQWNIKPWRVDVLKTSPTAEVALTEAADAHLILIAVLRFESFGPWLLDWLERWAVDRKVKDAGLALWDGRTLAHAQPELSHFAGRHGMRLTSYTTALAENTSSVVANDQHDYYQHWGINE